MIRGKASCVDHVDVMWFHVDFVVVEWVWIPLSYLSPVELTLGRHKDSDDDNMLTHSVDMFNICSCF